MSHAVRRFVLLLPVLIATTALSAVAQSETIVAYTKGNVVVKGDTYFGQSFTTPQGGPWDNITINFYPDAGVTPTAAGTAYLFTSAYGGTPAGLASSSFMAKSTGIAHGAYVFDPSVTLKSGTQYFFYADTSALHVPGGIALSIGTLQGGNVFLCCLNNNTDFTPYDITSNFRVAGIAVAPPVLTTYFLPQVVTLNGGSEIFFDIKNSISRDLTGLAFTDHLPAGMVIAPTSKPSGSPLRPLALCTGTVTAVPGTSLISLAKGTLHKECSLVFSVKVDSYGPKTNTTSAITSDQTVPGAPGTGTLRVVQPPAILKAFDASSIPLNATTSLTFITRNPNSDITLIDMAFEDVLPSGLQVASPSNQRGSCLDEYEATVKAIPGGNTINLVEMELPPEAMCTITVDVIGVQAGNQVNTSSAFTAVYDDGSGTTRPISGNQATATIMVTGARKR